MPDGTNGFGATWGFNPWLNRHEPSPQPAEIDAAKSATAIPTAECLTESVPEAGWRMYRLKPQASYRAAERGDIITIRLGKKLRAPIAANNRKLEQAGK